MLAMSASMPRAMDARVGDVLSGLSSDWRRGGGRLRRTGDEGLGARRVGDERRLPPRPLSRGIVFFARRVGIIFRSSC